MLSLIISRQLSHAVSAETFCNVSFSSSTKLIDSMSGSVIHSRIRPQVRQFDLKMMNYSSLVKRRVGNYLKVIHIDTMSVTCCKTVFYFDFGSFVKFIWRAHNIGVTYYSKGGRRKFLYRYYFSTSYPHFIQWYKRKKIKLKITFFSVKYAPYVAVFTCIIYY